MECPKGFEMKAFQFLYNTWVIYAPCEFLQTLGHVGQFKFVNIIMLF